VREAEQTHTFGAHGSGGAATCHFSFPWNWGFSFISYFMCTLQHPQAVVCTDLWLLKMRRATAEAFLGVQ
jgi:hypothetical protein